MKERLQKTLARAGVASRRASEELIRDGRVRVNGRIITDMGISVDPESDRIEFDSRPLPIPRPPRVLMLNKPVGYVCTSRISRETAPSVLDLVPTDRRYFSIGGLDRDTSGLLLLTDDGDLAFRLTHPKHGTRKFYEVETNHRLTDEELAELEEGVMIDDGLARAVEVKRLPRNRIRVVLAEGRKHQVRRMIQAVGARVRSLRRSGLGPLRLGDLPEGQWRELTPREIHSLRGTPRVVPRA